MSEKFGLNWKEYPNDRIQDLISVHTAINKKADIENKRNKIKQK
jgi:hypothetical protein